MDEADRILNMDFEQEVDKILKVIPKDRTTYLYSATMTKKVQGSSIAFCGKKCISLLFMFMFITCKYFQVAKLQRASLRNPVKVEVSTKYQTVEKLLQYYLFIPAKFKVQLCYRSLIENRKIEFKKVIFP